MSRIGKKPIPLPDKVTIQIGETEVQVKGPHGTLTRAIPEVLQVKIEEKQVVVSPKGEITPTTGSMHGLIRTLISNMITGVVTPWKKDLEIHGVGYRANKSGQVLNLQLGYSHPINFSLPEAVQFTVDAKQTFLSLSCADKELLGNVAAKIRGLRPPEPYKGKGIRYVGERILRKAGKAAGSVGGAGGK